MLKIVRLPSLVEGSQAMPLMPLATRALAVAASTLALVVVALSRRLRRPRRRAGRPAAGAAGQRRARRCSARVVDSEEFSGRLEAAEYVELRPRVSGTIDRVHFTDGALVRKGELLFTIDPRPFEAEAARAAVAARRRPRPSSSWRRASSRARRSCSTRRRCRSQEVDQLDLRLAHLAGRHPGRRGGAARRPAQPRVHARSARRSRAAPRAPTSPPATSSTSSRC